jgi:hypothetical protein
MSDVTKYLDEVTEAVNEAKNNCVMFVDEGIMSAGSNARKSLITARKSINALRKVILASQKETKQARKAAKIDKSKKKSE